MEYKYKHITVKNIPEKDTTSYQLLLLCLSECDFENDNSNRIIYGDNMEAFSFSYLTECGVYKTVEEAEAWVHEDLDDLLDVTVCWSKKGRNGGSGLHHLFTGFHARKDVLIVYFVPLSSHPCSCTDEMIELYEQVLEGIQTW